MSRIAAQCASSVIILFRWGCNSVVVEIGKNHWCHPSVAVILQELPTTVDEDVNLLSDENLSECMRLAIVWRLSYKR